MQQLKLSFPQLLELHMLHLEWEQSTGLLLDNLACMTQAFASQSRIVMHQLLCKLFTCISENFEPKFLVKLSTIPRQRTSNTQHDYCLWLLSICITAPKGKETLRQFSVPKIFRRDKAGLLRASCVHYFDHERKVAVAATMHRVFSTK